MAVTPLPAPEPADELLEIDPNTLTLGELETIEELAGRNITAELGRGQPSAKALTAIVYVFKRRTDPNITLDDVRAMDVRQFRVEAAADPKEPTG